MNNKYKCSICGKEYSNVDDYLKCVTKCAADLKKNQQEKERLEKINAALNGVKQAEQYFQQKLKEFKEEYPDEYKLNFGDKSCCCDKTKVNPKHDSNSDNSTGFNNECDNELYSELHDSVNDLLGLLRL